MDKESTLIIVGDVQKVVQGTLRPRDFYSLPSEALTFSLGAATELSEKQTGEALMWGGKALLHPSQHTLDIQRISGKIRTPFCMGIQACPKVKGIHHSFSQARSLQTLYEQLGKQPALGFCVLGIVEFGELEGVYLQKPPIFKESLLGENFSQYFSSSPTYVNQLAVTVGVVIPKKSPKALKWKTSLQKGFYQSPKEEGQKELLTLTHTHVALLERKKNGLFSKELPELLTSIPLDSFQEVYHLFPHSTVKRGTFFIQELQALKTIG